MHPFPRLFKKKKSSTLQIAVFVDAQKPNSDLKARP